LGSRVGAWQRLVVDVLGTLVVVEKLPPLFDLGGDWGMRMGGAEDGDRGRWG
jgi:hypothetical protein